MIIYTVGHSNLELDEFISKLTAYGIKCVCDIRAFPSSKKFPQFHKAKIQVALFLRNINYIWMGRELGGFRNSSEGLGESSPNKGWEKEGFRIYADYMLSQAFKKAACRLEKMGKEIKTAIMCAEKIYLKCHRQLISDYLVSKGHTVFHIIETTEMKQHALTQFAKFENNRLTYPPDEEKDPEPLLPF